MPQKYTDFIPDDEKKGSIKPLKKTISADEHFIPDDETDDEFNKDEGPSAIKQFGESIAKFVTEHPALKKIIHGPSEEEKANKPETWKSKGIPITKDMQAHPENYTRNGDYLGAPERGIVSYKGGDIGGIYDELRRKNTDTYAGQPWKAAAASLATEPARFLTELANDPFVLASGGPGKLFSKAGGAFGDLKAARARVPQVADLGVAPSEQKLLGAGPRFQAEPVEGEIVPDVADTRAGESLPIRRSREVPYRPTTDITSGDLGVARTEPFPYRTQPEIPTGRLAQSYSTAFGDTPRAVEARKRFAEQASREPITDESRLLPEGVRQPRVEDLTLSEEGTLPGEMSKSDALTYEPEFKPWRGLSNLSESILGRDIMARDVEVGRDPFRGPIDWNTSSRDDELIRQLNEESRKMRNLEFVNPDEPPGERLQRWADERAAEKAQSETLTLTESKPTAKYKYTWEDENGNPMPMYEVIGGESHGSDASAEGLKKLGIEVPETPEQGFIADSDQTAGGIYPTKNKAALDQFARGVQGQAESEGAERAGQDLEDIFKKTSPEDYEPPLAMKVPGSENIAVGGADPRVLDVLGKSLYSGDRPTITVRELLQNAFDEHRIAGQTKDIKVLFGYDHPNPATGEKATSITVKDLGRGLTPEQLYTVFTDVGKTGKGDELLASGGFGFAKAAPLLSGKYAKVESVVQEGLQRNKYTFEGTPEQLKDQKVGVPLKKEKVSLSTPTGMKVTTFFDKDKNLGNAHNFAGMMTEASPSITSKVHVGQSFLSEEEYQNNFLGGISNPNVFDISKDYAKLHEKKPPLPKVDTIETPHFKVDLHYEDPTGIENSKYQLNFQNKGLYSGSLAKNYNYGNKILNAPSRIDANIISKVEEGEEGYPFTASREMLSDEVTDEINQWIHENIVKGSLEKERQKLQNAYDSMKDINVGSTTNRKTVLFDPGNRLTPQEIEQFQNNPVIQEFAKHIDSTINDILESLGDTKAKERLEGVGIILHDSVHGLHVPNPSTGKSTILINPFEHLKSSPIEEAALENQYTILHEVGHVGRENPTVIPRVNINELSDPRIGSFMNAYLEALSHQGVSPGHEVDFLKRLAVIYAKYGPSKSFKSADEISRIFRESPGSENLSEDVQGLLQLYQESRGRTATTEDILSRTGLRSEVGKPKGKGNNASNVKPDGKGTPPNQATLDRLFDAMSAAKDVAEEQATNLRVERARRFAASAGVKSEGMAGAKASLGKMKGEYEKSELPDALKMKKEDVDSLFTAVKTANITQGEKLRGYTALFKLLNGEAAPVRSELKILDDVFGGGFSDKIVEMHGGIGMVGLKLAKAANTSKALMSSADVSAPLKQGIGLVHRPEYRDAFKEMFKYLAKPEYYNASMEALQNRPTYLLGREAGLFLAKPDSLLQGEEAFMNNYLGHNVAKYTGVQAVVGASERAYTGFLNKLRADVFDSLIREARAAGHEAFTIAEHTAEDGTTKKLIVPSKTTENIAKYINVATGRGSLGRLEKIAPELNMLIWSPRLISSRLTTLNPMYYANLDPFTKKQAIKSLFGIAAFGAITSSLAAVAGAKVLGNPLSTPMNWGKQILSADFGKARFAGNKVLDTWAGFQQPIVAAARFIAGSTDTGSQARSTTAGNFAVNKLSPIASLAFDIASAKKWTGGGNYMNRFSQAANLPREVVKRFVPIFMQDMTDLIKTDSSFAETVGFGTAGALGMGVQDYPERTGAKRMRRMTLRP